MSEEKKAYLLIKCSTLENFPIEDVPRSSLAVVSMPKLRAATLDERDEKPARIATRPKLQKR